ncbi:hydrolase [Mycena rosella]|uniref:Hydrolase n=1 Tax=Mycena rosella TaxID=1033263 RepID=A0AAD7CH44_MYCRO|nr:hydrolase [Mycena rosella]
MFSFLAIFITALSLAESAYSCSHVGHPGAARRLYQEGLEIARMNNIRRGNQQTTSAAKSIAITNVRVFDGEKLLPLNSVYIAGGIIVPYAEGAEVVDGNGGVLLSGLIDAHTHPASVAHLEVFASNGVTTAIVASCFPATLCNSLLNHAGLPDVRFSGLFATTPNSTHALMFGLLPATQIITSASQAPGFVADQLASGATFIKVIAEAPDFATTLDQATTNALVTSAHANHLCVACHAADYAAVGRALTAHVNQAHHVPTDTPLDAALLARFVAQGTVSVPTLSIFATFLAIGQIDAAGYVAANTSVTRLRAAGVPVLAGTDSHDLPAPFAPPFGSSLHAELELLVQAGLSTVEALRSATVLAAQHNLLFDRGVVAPGMRADLLLISGDPIANISATRNIQRVWIAGVEYAGVATN